jgi:5'(3')-deoxyribonucleotidase
LTAIPKRWAWPDVTKQKRGWIKNYLPEISDDRIRFGPYAEDKQYHCTGHLDILIDDKIRNIEQWRARGGTGICHTSALDTIKQLRELGFK